MSLPIANFVETDTFRTWFLQTNAAIDALNENVIGDNTVVYGVFTVGANSNTSLSVANSLFINTSLVLVQSNSSIIANVTVTSNANVFNLAAGSVIIQPVNGTVVNSAITVNATALLKGATTVNNSFTVNGAVTMNGAVGITGTTTANGVIFARQVAFTSANSVLSPSTLTDPQYNDYAPTGIGDAQVLNLTPGINTVLTGIQAPTVLGSTGARLLYIQNLATLFKVTLAAANNSSAANNQFTTPGSQNIDILPGAAILLSWVTTNHTWRVVAPLSVTQSDLTLTGNLSVAGASTLTGNVSFGANAAFGTTLVVNRATGRVGVNTAPTGTAAFEVNGLTSLGTTQVGGDLGVTSTITVVGNASISNSALQVTAVGNTVTVANTIQAASVSQSFIRSLLVQSLSGNGTASLANLIAVGNTSLANLAVSGTFTGAALTLSGALIAASLAVTGAVSGGSGSISGTFTVGTLNATLAQPTTLEVGGNARWATSNSMSGFGARTDNTIYQAASDGFILLTIDSTITSGSIGYHQILMDTVSPPTIQIAKTGLTNDVRTMCVPIPKGYYWKTLGTYSSGGPAVSLFFVPLGYSGG